MSICKELSFDIVNEKSSFLLTLMICFWWQTRKTQRTEEIFNKLSEKLMLKKGGPFGANLTVCAEKTWELPGANPGHEDALPKS